MQESQLAFKAMVMRKDDERYIYVWTDNEHNRWELSALITAQGMRPELSITEDEADDLVSHIWGECHG
jgi:hypothetical protein